MRKGGMRGHDRSPRAFIKGRESRGQTTDANYRSILRPRQPMNAYDSCLAKQLVTPFLSDLFRFSEHATNGHKYMQENDHQRGPQYYIRSIIT